MEINIAKLWTTLYDAITFEIFLKFGIVYFFIIWIAILLWVIKDISNRTNSIVLQIISILVILFLTPFWIFIYLLIRPGKTLFEKCYNEIEDNLETFNQIIEEKTKWLDEDIACPKCEELVSHDFKYCPKCKISLKNECTWCSKLLDSDWKVCPYCWVKQKKDKSKKKTK